MIGNSKNINYKNCFFAKNKWGWTEEKILFKFQIRFFGVADIKRTALSNQEAFSNGLYEIMDIWFPEVLFNVFVLTIFDFFFNRFMSNISFEKATLSTFISRLTSQHETLQLADGFFFAFLSTCIIFAFVLMGFMP